jgi:HEAT repeat protein
MKHAGGEKMSAATGEHHAPLSVPSDPDTINELIASLGDHDGLVRQRARHSLVAIGRPTAPALVEALTDPNGHRRWEAAKALGAIRAPLAAPALVRAMEDQDFGVRWLAAEGLIGLKRAGLAPLLQALANHPDSVFIREGAHHVCRMLVDHDLHDLVAPVLAALDGVEPVLEVPPAARAALDELDKATGVPG